MPVIERAGLVVDLIDEGSGPPVLLAHSSVSGNRQWRRLIEQLKGRYRVLAPNLMGYGETTPWTVDGTQTLLDAARVLLAVADDLDGPLRLVGHSWGGGVALRAASVLGERVSHLAVFEPMVPHLLRAHGRTDAAAEARGLHDDVKRLGGGAPGRRWPSGSSISSMAMVRGRRRPRIAGGSSPSRSGRTTTSGIRSTSRTRPTCSRR